MSWAADCAQSAWTPRRCASRATSGCCSSPARRSTWARWLGRERRATTSRECRTRPPSTRVGRWLAWERCASPHVRAVPDQLRLAWGGGRPGSASATLTCAPCPATATHLRAVPERDSRQTVVRRERCATRTRRRESLFASVRTWGKRQPGAVGTPGAKARGRSRRPLWLGLSRAQRAGRARPQLMSRRPRVPEAARARPVATPVWKPGHGCWPARGQTRADERVVRARALRCRPPAGGLAAGRKDFEIFGFALWIRRLPVETVGTGR